MTLSYSDEGILLVANYESDVGFAWWLMENFWVELSQLFERRGGKTVLVYPKVNEVPEKIRNAPITVLTHDFGCRSWKNTRALKKIVKDNRIAHVYLTDKGGYDMRYMMLRYWGIKTIVNHDHSFRPPNQPSSLKLLLNALLHKFPLISCDHYFAVSKFIQERLVHDASVDPDKVSCVLNGIEPIEIDRAEQYYAHETFGVPSEAVIVVSTGRAAFSKGVHLLIEAARRLVEGGNTNLYFLHCGVGPDLCTFQDMVKKYGLEHRFIFGGRRDDIRHILPSCHIGIQISQGEAFSLALLEYLAAGLATMASDVGGNPEAIMHEKTGILFPVNNLSLVVSILDELSRNAKYRAELGAAARESVLEKFSIERANREFLVAYEDVIARVGKRR